MKKSLTVILAVLLALFVFVSCEQSVGDLIGFNLVFKANGGTGTMETVFIKGSSIPAPENEFERTGYTFSSWNTMADGSGTEYEVGDTINGHDVQSVTLFAQWTASLYNITIADAEHGSAVAKCNETSTVSNGDSFIPLVATPHTGYKLANYNVEGEGASIVDNEYLKIAAGTSGAITVTPVFEKVVYAITVNDTELGLGSAEVTGYTISNYTNVVTLSATPYSAYSNYVMLFDWQLSAPAGVTIANGTISIPADTIGDITVTPVFSPKTGDIYLVTLHTAGGTIAEGQDVAFYKHGDGTTVLPTSVTRTESSFQGWYDNSGYTGDAVESFSNDDTGNKEFWAKWNTNSYTVTLNKNGGTINSGNVTSYTYGTGAILPTDVTKTGYTFGGWYDNSELSGNPVTTISSTDTGNKSFYAKWTVNTYNVTLVPKGGTINSGNVTTYTYGVGATLPTDVTKTENSFGGWYDNSELSGDPVTAISTTDTGNKTFYAKWNLNSYTVTLNKDGGTVDSGYDVASYSYSVGVELPTAYHFSKTGYTFGGWYDNSGLSGDPVTAISTTETGAKEFWAKWTVNSYTVTLNKDGGTINSGNVTSYTYGTGATLPTDVTKTGYTFGGWYDNEGCTGTAVDSISTDATGNKTFYAKWTANTYYVVFNGNESTGGSMENQQFTYDQSQNLTANDYTKDGYTFTGWNTAANGSGTPYNNSEYVKNLATSGTITLYAQWH